MMYSLGPLHDDEVHVWLGTAPAETPYPDWILLSDGERARWRRLGSATRAASYASSHAATRRILGRYLSTAPSLVHIGRTACLACGRVERGRPIVYTAGEPLWFSLSHSGRRWLLAAGRHPVGVDIECERPLDVQAMAALALCAPEQEVIQHHPEFFLRSWTRKEAVFKATGGSGFTDLAQLDVDPATDDDVVVPSPSRAWPGKLRIRTLHIAPGSHAAVASPADVSGRVIARIWPSGEECGK